MKSIKSEDGWLVAFVAASNRQAEREAKQRESKPTTPTPTPTPAPEPKPFVCPPGLEALASIF